MEREENKKTGEDSLTPRTIGVTLVLNFSYSYKTQHKTSETSISLEIQGSVDPLAAGTAAGKPIT